MNATTPSAATARPAAAPAAGTELLSDLEQLRRRLEAATASIEGSLSPSSEVDDAQGQQWVLERSAELAAALMDVPADRLLVRGRQQPVADARAVAHAAARRCGLTLPRIAGYYGQHHTTVMHSVEKVAGSPQLRTATDLIAAHLRGVAPAAAEAAAA